MRSPLGKELRKQFTAELARRLPHFRRVEARPPGTDPKWVFELAPDLKFFISLHAFPQHDEFALEVGWTDGGEIGFRDNYRPSVDTAAKKWGARLSQLWNTGPSTGAGEQVWEVAPRPSPQEKEQWAEAFRRGEVPSYLAPDPPVEEVLPRVGPLVSDAVDKLEQYALPVFRRVAEERGLSWPG